MVAVEWMFMNGFEENLVSWFLRLYCSLILCCKKYFWHEGGHLKSSFYEMWQMQEKPIPFLHKKSSGKKHIDLLQNKQIQILLDSREMLCFFLSTMGGFLLSIFREFLKHKHQHLMNCYQNILCYFAIYDFKLTSLWRNMVHTLITEMKYLRLRQG